MKKHITRLLCAVLLLLALCIGALAAGTSGKCGPSAYWSFDSSTGTLTISGSGAMDDYEFENESPWLDYRDSIQTIVIGDQITKIGRCAFPWTACRTIKFGKNVRSIGERAFYCCEKLNGDLTLPDSVEIIGYSAFSGCTSLTGTLTLGSGLQTIDTGAFGNCSFSGDLVIPDSVTTIGDEAFRFWISDGTLTLGKGLRTIGASAFLYADFSGELLIPDSVKTVGESAFYHCEGFTGLKLSTGLTKIEAQSFAHMYSLKTEVVIPEGVTELGASAFSCSHMPSVRFPSTLKKIGREAFYNCFGYLDNRTITFPDGLEVIEDEAFIYCYFKKAIVLPASVKSIGKNAFYGYSYYGSNTLGVYFLGAPPKIVGTLNANCSFPSDWTLFYLPGTSGWTGNTYADYKIAPWDGETRWDNLRTNEFGYGWDNKGNEIEASWSVNTDTGKITLTDDLNEGCAVAVSYDAEGRVTGIGVLRTKQDSVRLNLQDTCRLFLLNASSAPRLRAPVIINDYLPV